MNARAGYVQVASLGSYREVITYEPMDAYHRLQIELESTAQIWWPDSSGRYTGAEIENGTQRVPVAKS